MNVDLRALLALKQVLLRVSEGRGTSGSIVDVLGKGSSELRGAARLTLLGYPARVALNETTVSGSSEVAMLAAFISAGPLSDSALMGRKGQALTETLERWAKARESRAMEQKVMRLRVFMIAATLGGVLGMVSSIGGLIGGLSFLGSASSFDSGGLVWCGAAMASISSSALGLFVSSRTSVVCLGLALAAFALASTALSPLTAVPLPPLWGIK